MKLKLIAEKQQQLSKLSQLCAASGIELAGVWAAAGDEEDTNAELGAIRRYEHWDDLISSGDCDGLLVSGSSAEVIAATKLFLTNSTSSASPSPRTEVSTGLCFVLTTDASSLSTLFEFLILDLEYPGRLRPIFAAGVMSQREGSLPQPVRVEFVRKVVAAADGRVTLSQMDQQLFQDLSWLAPWCGPFETVTTLLTGGTDNAFAEAQVNLAGADAVDVKWLCVAADRPGWELTLFTPLDIQKTSSSDVSSHLADEEIVQSLRQQRPTPGWAEVNRWGEIGAAARKSIVKRRTISILYEESSERQQFKSQMTAIGCGVLLWVMFGMIGMLFFATAFDPRDRELRNSLAADFVLFEEDFHTTELAPAGESKVTRMTQNWSEVSPVVIIETAELETTNVQRTTAVQEQLEAAAIRDAEGRIVVRPITGQWFETAMTIGWLIVFLPLGFILAAQAFIVIARSPQ